MKSYGITGNGSDRWDLSIFHSPGIELIQSFTAEEEIEIYLKKQKEAGIEEPRIISREEGYLRAKERAIIEKTRLEHYHPLTEK